MAPGGRNNCVRRYLFIIYQNGDLGQDFIGCFNRLPGCVQFGEFRLRSSGCPWSPEFEDSSSRLVVQGPAATQETI
jgi:hypothetical protein